MKQIKLLKQTVLMAGLLIAGQPNVEAQTVMEPSFKWGDYATGSGWSDVFGYGTKMCTDEKENVYTAASFVGTIDFDPGPDTHELTAGSISSVYIKKTDSSGNFEWVKELRYDEASTLGFPLFDITTVNVDKIKGDVYITGIYGDTTIDFDPGLGVYHMSPFPYDAMGTYYYPSVFILKLDANGNFKWCKSLDIFNGGSISACAINSDIADGMLYFLGHLIPFAEEGTIDVVALDFDPGPGVAPMTPSNLMTFPYLLALNGDGEFQWVKALATTADSSFFDFADVVTRSMVIDENGELYCSAVFRGDFDVDPGPGVNMFSGNGSMSLMNYSADGELEWIKQGQLGATVSGGVALTSSFGFTDMAYENNALYFAYASNGPINVDNTIPFGGASTADIVYSTDIYTNGVAFTKFDSDGNFKWSHQLGGIDTAKRVSDPKISVFKDKIALVANYTNEVDVDPGAEIKLLSGEQSFLAIYDTAGTLDWYTDVAVGSEGYRLYTHSVSNVYPHIYYAGSWMGGNIDINPTEDEFLLVPVDEATYSSFVAKIRLNVVDTTTGIRKEHRIQASVFPNPNQGSLQIQLSKPISDGTIDISDVTGRKVFSTNNLSGSSFVFDIGHLLPGSYLLDLITETKRGTYKLIKP